jgi:hypothetical protein
MQEGTCRKGRNAKEGKECEGNEGRNVKRDEMEGEE